MSAGRRRVLAVLLVAAAACAGGCGGDRTRAVDRSDTSPSSGAVTQPAPTADPALPRGVPLRATGPARPASRRVIRRWLAALSRGDVRRAAHFFALPSKFQNAGTPVLRVDTDKERIAVNLSLPCGATAERTGGAGRYTIVLFRLKERPGPGGGCGAGTGQTTRGAIVVARGHIREWYRLPDDVPAAQATAPAI